MGKRTRGRDLQIIMEVGGGDADFPITIEGLNKSVVRRDEMLAKKFIDEF